MKCGGTTKMAKGGSIMNKPAMKKQPVNLYGIPQENTGTSGQYGLMKKGGAVKKMAKGGPVNKELKARGELMAQVGTDFKNQGVGMKYSGEVEKARGLGMKAKGMALKEKGKTMKSEGRTLKAAGQILDRMKSGGATKNTKLAALAAPKNKITRADIIVGAKRNAKKK
jgi:hypothetical protein